MKTRELSRQNELAGQLQTKLERIAKLVSELPSEDDLLTMVNLADALGKSLERATVAYTDEEFPVADSLIPTLEVAVSIAKTMEEVSEAELDIPA